MTIAGHTVDTVVNLTSRKQFSAPILIGKTYLDDNAWVFAGYDYLQEQPNAKMIGKKETVEIEGIPTKPAFRQAAVTPTFTLSTSKWIKKPSKCRLL